MPEETIEERYCRQTPGSRERFEAGRNFTAGPAKGAYFFSPYPLSFVSGEGCQLQDFNVYNFFIN